ncbi:MAG: DUF4855 domain-containing protein [Massilibacteroides sp.]|nr:DUF4855 domain-containing protein [Massilibacteroides sp.]
MLIRIIRKTYLVYAALISSFFTTHTAIAYQTDIVKDIALIYQGGTQRPDWTEEELSPYVVHTFANGQTTWFFDSFLFLEFTDNWQIAFGYNYGTRNAKKSDWEWLLNRIFEEGRSLDALNSCIEHYKKIIGEPQFKHKIVLGIVSPITDQTDWGNLDGKALNFSDREDQIKAAKWYIDQLIKRFNEKEYQNLELIGFYWLEESTVKCGDLPKYISKYIHQLNKRFYWIPYWNAQGYNLWKKLGFDTAFLQPNYFFNKEITDDRLDQACNTANKFNMALEMEFDSRVLYENDDSYYSRLESYINAFEDNGVFEKSAIAYYSGTKGILDMYRSNTVENTLILDRIVNHILKRRSMEVSLETINKPITDNLVIGGSGELYVSGEAKSIKIFTINGLLISENTKRLRCAPGIYIVIVDGKTQKVIVR